jgi:hypothetical protein
MRLGILIFVLAVAAVGEIWLSNRPSTPPLASNLPNNLADADREFDRRIHEHFPIGSSAADLIRELRQQGFDPSPDRGDSPLLHVYSLRKSGFPCNLELRVIWTADGSGTVTMADGAYGGICL